MASINEIGDDVIRTGKELLFTGSAIVLGLTLQQWIGIMALVYLTLMSLWWLTKTYLAWFGPKAQRLSDAKGDSDG